MKKLLMTGLFLILTCITTSANEITEDYFDIATNYCIQGNYQEAITYLDKIILAEPENKSVKDLRNGLAQIMQGKNTAFISSDFVKRAIKAKKDGDNTAELNALTGGTDYWSNYFTGEYYKQNKDYKQAIQYYIKSINLMPSLTQCYLQIALCYYNMGNYNQAITYLTQYLKVNPKDDFAYFLRAKANANNGYNENALSDALTATALDNNLNNRFLEGKILYKIKHYEQAKNKLKELTSDIQTAEIYKYIGLCEAELGNRAEALSNLDKSLLLNNEDKFVISKYNELKN